MGNLVAEKLSDLRRSSRRRVSVPREAEGRIAALAATRNGDDDAFRRWEHDAGPILRRALRRAGFDPASADEAILYLLEQADGAVRSHRPILCEAAWMSAVLTSARTQRHLARQRQTRAYRRLAFFAPQGRGSPCDAEEREELLVAAARLSPRLALAIRLRLRGLAPREVWVALSVELAVGIEQARRIERRSLAMMRSARSASAHIA